MPYSAPDFGKLLHFSELSFSHPHKRGWGGKINLDAIKGKFHS